MILLNESNRSLFSLSLLLGFLLAPWINGANGLIDGPFAVKVGSGGGCDAQKAALDVAFREAVAMAKAATTAIDKVSSGRFNWVTGTKEKVISGTLQALFNIKTGSWSEGLISQQDAARLTKIRSTYQVIVDWSSRTDKSARLYCNDDWLEWRIDGNTGQGYWYSADHKIEIIGKENEKWCRDFPNTGAITMHQIQTITWCPRAFTGFPNGNKYKENLVGVKSHQGDIPGGTYIDDFNSISGQFLHELTHLLGNGQGDRIIDRGAFDDKGDPIDKQAAYGYYLAYWLAKKNPDFALTNADNFHQFALAMYLDTIDWATGENIGHSPEAETLNTANVLDEEGMTMKWKTLTFKPATKAQANVVSPTPQYPLVTEPVMVDPFFQPDMKQVSKAASMINAMTKKEAETSPKMLVPHETGKAEFEASEQLVIAEL